MDAGKYVDAQWECVEVLLNGFFFFNEIRRPLIKNRCEISMRVKVRMKYLSISLPVEEFLDSFSLRQWHPTPVLCLENPMDRGAR